jgi:hypothetical protein
MMKLPLAFLSLFFLSTASAESDCGLIELQTKRSFNTTVISNPCTSEDILGLGSVIQISPGGRIWIKGSSLASNTPIQLICQNNNHRTVLVKLSSLLAPWIRINNLNHCKTWIEQRLVCHDEKTKEKIFLCALSITKITSPNKHIQPTTSVKMRAINIDKQNIADQIILAIQADIELCLKLFNQQTQLWSITTDLDKNLIQFKSPKNYDISLNACLSSIEKNSQLPAPWRILITH